LNNELFGEYIKALEDEIKRRGDMLQKAPISTLYIGGGTPSLIDEKLYEKLFKKLSPYLHDVEEITIEANPESLKKGWIKHLKDFGVNRVSMGVQSFFPKKLTLLQREHGELEIKKGVEFCREAGIKNISIDLMYGTIYDDVDFIAKELDMALELGIEHISAYSLTIEDGSRLGEEEKGEDEECGIFLAHRLKEAGYEWYEVSNFGKIKSLHNLGYWMGKEYIGLGAGAVGRVGDARYTNTKNPDEYIAMKKSESIEILDNEKKRVESIFLGLRCEVGVELSLLDSKKVNILIDEGIVKRKGCRIYANDYFRSDEIALYLL